MSKILIVEDDEASAKILSDRLKKERYVVDVAYDGDSGLHMAVHYEYEVLIVDWELPGLSGVEMIRQCREAGGSARILMLTGRKSDEDKVEGLDTGADDYLSKPYSFSELQARLRALLRRTESLGQDKLKVADLILDLHRKKLLRDGEEVALLPLEYALLEFFMRNPNRIFTGEELLKKIWSSNSEATVATVRTYVARLRGKLGSRGRKSIVSTVHGLGYKLDLE